MSANDKTIVPPSPPAGKFMYFGFFVGKQKLHSFLDQYPIKHPEDPRARVLQQLPDANKAFLTATMLQHRLRLPDLGVYGIVINNTVSDMLAFGTSKQQFSINVDVLDEIATELGAKKSDAAWYMPAMDEDEWDELTE